MQEQRNPQTQTSYRMMRLLAFLMSAAAIITLVVACSRDPLATMVVEVPGAIPDRGTTLVATSQPANNGFSCPAATADRSPDDMARLNKSCLACHTASDNPTMHTTAVSIACIDCHGGFTPKAWEQNVPDHADPKDPNYQALKLASHVTPRLPDLWKQSGNPPVPGTLTLRESNDYIRFVNPGDLRAAQASCGACHNTAGDQFAVNHVKSGMMAHGAMLWEAALYNNGSIARKNAVYGEFYDQAGLGAMATANPLPTLEQSRTRGMLSRLWPLPRWEVTQPGNILRVFERGGERRPIVGVPDSDEAPGQPDDKLSVRGLGTDLRTDPVFIGLQKSRLLDPTLNLFGTNDHAGDYRGSGCTACHVVYANDRSHVHSGGWGDYGNRGQSFSVDPTVNPDGVTQPYDKPFANEGRSGIVHPVKHQFVRSAPTSSCIVCHVHPGTNVVNAYLGYTWWDNETDGESMYPRKQKNPTAEDEYRVSQSNPEGAAARGLWSDPEFLKNVGSPQFNSQLKHTQFADFHGHGWVFRAVFKQDRHGNLLDSDGKKVTDIDAAKMKQGVNFQSTPDNPHTPSGIPVHLKDIHLEKGMQCVDCHFRQDVHGDGNLYGETRAAVEVDCIDCHGTAQKPAVIAKYFELINLADKLAKSPSKRAQATKDKANADELLPQIFTGSAAATTLDLAELTYRKNLLSKHFGYEDGHLVQKPAMDADQLPADQKDKAPPPTSWVVTQVSDTAKPDSDWSQKNGVDPAHPLAQDHARLARFAHTVRKDGVTWGTAPDENATGDMALAHGNKAMSCYACHSSWNTSCFGCHLPMRANQMKPMLHNEGAVTRNYTNYNYQTLRDDVFMLGIDSTVKGHKVVPVRSACAVMVSSQNANREWIYSQQQTVSAEGFSGTSFSPYFPHTVRGVETKQCTDCHVAKDGDNNAIMAQLLMQGTHAVNFIGRYAWVAEGDHGLQAVAVTEHDEPQAVIGSRLQQVAYPDNFAKHLSNGSQLTEAYGHSGTVLDLQLRGEYLYAACGSNGFIAYDVANIDNKGFSERIITAPVSPLGQQFYVPSKFATSICSPSTMAIDPTRPHRADNEEQHVSPLYAYLYLTDRDEGLIVIGNPADSPKPGVSTLLDGNPENNFLQRALTYNPGGVLRGARSMSLCGNYAYICCDSGLKVLDLKDPLHPHLLQTPGIARLSHPKKIVFQFRFGFVIDDEGLKTINVTNPENPEIESVFGDKVADCKIPDARDICLCRTYAYVAAGANGLVIVNVERPQDSYSWKPFTYNANGRLIDSTSVRVGMTNSSLFAYVADGIGGLKVVQLTSELTPGYLGFSPVPVPQFIASYPTKGPAIALSGGLDRDRAVDESGNQLSVFGRRGARPFTLEEQQKLYLKPGAARNRSSVYTVTSEPQTAPSDK
jgi:hypothetical protein